MSSRPHAPYRVIPSSRPLSCAPFLTPPAIVPDRYIARTPRPRPGGAGYDQLRAVAPALARRLLPPPSPRTADTAGLGEELLGELAHMWVPSELRAARFTYAERPVYLSELPDEEADEAGSDDGWCAEEDGPSGEMGDMAAGEEAAAPVLFSATLVDVDRQGVRHEVALTVTTDHLAAAAAAALAPAAPGAATPEAEAAPGGGGDDWRHQCLAQTLAAGVTDRLKMLYVCAQVRMLDMHGGSRPRPSHHRSRTDHAPCTTDHGPHLLPLV